MSVKNFFRELLIAKANKQAHLIDSISEEAPILESMPMAPASDGFQHLYEELSDVVGAKVVDLDSELPLIDANGKLVSKNLSVLGGTMSVGEDKAKRMGGAPAYFNSKLPSIFRETGANVEKSWIQSVYDFAKVQGQQTLAGSTDADINYSIVAIKWVEGETSGLYDPSGFGDGKVFDIKALYNGALCDVDDGNGNTIPGFKVRVKNYLGFLLAKGQNVATIRNINLTTAATDSGFKNFPTESEIDALLDRVRRNPSNTRLYMHPKVLSALNVYKGGALEMTPNDMNFNRIIDHWNGVPIVTSYNFSETEALATA